MSDNPIDNPSTADPVISSEERSDEQRNANSLVVAFAQYQQKVLDLQTKIADTERKIDQSKDKNIETLGLFVALFTFISVEFSLFKEVNVFSVAISLTLIVAGLLSFFVLLLHVIVRFANKESRGWIIFYVLLFIISLGLISGGIYFPYSGIDKILINLTPTPTATPSATLMPTPY